MKPSMENWKYKSSSTINFALQYNVSWLKLCADWQTLNSFYLNWPIPSLRRFTGFLTEAFFSFLLGQNKIVKKGNYSHMQLYSVVTHLLHFPQIQLVLYRLCLWYKTYITCNWIARKSPQKPSMGVALYCWHDYFLLQLTPWCRMLEKLIYAYLVSCMESEDSLTQVFLITSRLMS